MDVVKTLSELSLGMGPSGFEAAVGAKVAELMAPLCDEVTLDPLGNVHGVRRAAVPDAPKLLLSAHLDEIGFLVTGTAEGFLRFRTVGGIDPRVLPAREVTVMTDPPLPGVISSVPPHLQTAGENKKPFEISDLVIDIGMGEERAKALVRPGTPVVFREHPEVLGGKYFTGKTLDDRACVVMLLRVLELLRGKELPVELVIQASTQEEIGAYGARVGAYGKAPDWAVAVDVTHAETPDSKGRDGVMQFGGGVPVSMGPNTNRKLGKKLAALAEEQGIGWQPDVMEGNTGTDAWVMQVAGNGTASCVVSLPLRYMHTAIEMISLEDLEAGAKLLSALALDPPERPEWR